MKQVVFATNNRHKLEEAQNILGSDFKILSLADIHCHEELPETSDTLEGNAYQKASYVWEHYLKGGAIPVFADDTGLEVEALGGEPGVLSARYAAIDGDSEQSHDSEANMKKLLRKLEGEENRKARFRTVVSLIMDDSDDTTEVPLYMEKSHQFEGIVEGPVVLQQGVAEEVVGVIDAGRKPLGDDLKELLGLVLVLPLLDSLSFLVIVDGLQRKVDVTFLGVHAENLTDDFLSFSDVVSDVFNPASGNVPDVNESFFLVVLVKGDECTEVLYGSNGADDELSILGEAPGSRHQPTTSSTSPLISPFPPLGVTRTDPQTWQSTLVAALLKTICSFPQSGHLTLTKLSVMRFTP